MPILKPEGGYNINSYISGPAGRAFIEMLEQDGIKKYGNFLSSLILSEYSRREMRAEMQREQAAAAREGVTA